MLIFRIFLVGSLPILLLARIEWDSAKVKQNLNWFNCTLTIKEVAGRKMLFSDLDLRQPIGPGLTLKLNVFRIFGEKKQLLLAMPKINYCDFRRGMGGTWNVFRPFVESFYKFGNLSLPCPWKIGYYYMKEVVVDDKMLPAFLRQKFGKVCLQAIAFEETSSKGKVWLATSDFFVIFSED